MSANHLFDSSSSGAERNPSRYFTRPAKDENYDSDDERKKRKRLRREMNTCFTTSNGVDDSSKTDPHAATTLPALCSQVAAIIGKKCQPTDVTDLQLPPDVVSWLQVPLKPFQVHGVDWAWRRLRNGLGIILADEMGLGKTIQSIGVFLCLRHYFSATQHGAVSPKLLVVTPLSVVPSWIKEFEAHVDAARCPLRVQRYGGSKEERDAVIAAVEDNLRRRRGGGGECQQSTTSTRRTGHHDRYTHDVFDVLITTPETILSDAFFISHLHFDILVFDEAHRLKNAQSRLYQLILSDYMSGIPYRMFLTGTPLSNAPVELWNLLRLVNPERCSGCRMLNGVDDDGNEVSDQVLGKHFSEPETSKALRTLSDLLLLRRLKKNVLATLPSMTEVLLQAPLSPLQIKMYASILRKDSLALASLLHHADSGTPPAGRTSLLNTVMQLRKCCNHPYMFPGVEPEPFVMGEHLIRNSAKMVLLDALLKKLKKEGHRTLLFSQFAYMLDILQDYLDYRQYSYVRLDGSVRGEDRETAVNEFQRGGGGGRGSDDNTTPFVFLLSTRAGGVGLTLTAADTVIFFDHDWNPQMDLQAQQRAHRIGQDKPVTVYRLCSQHSVEEGILTVATKKLKLAAEYIPANDDGSSKKASEDVPSAAAALSVSELKNIIRLGVAALPDGEEKKKARIGTHTEENAQNNEDEASWSTFIQTLNIDTLLSRSKDHVILNAQLGDALSSDDRKAFEEKLQHGDAILQKMKEEVLSAPRGTRGGGGDPSFVTAPPPLTLEHTATKTSEAERLLKKRKEWARNHYITSGLPGETSLYFDQRRGKVDKKGGGAEQQQETSDDKAEEEQDAENAARGIVLQSLHHHARASASETIVAAFFEEEEEESHEKKPTTKKKKPRSSHRVGGDNRDDAVAEEDDDTVAVSHIEGDLLRPVLPPASAASSGMNDDEHGGNSRHRRTARIIVVPVNNSGTWGSGRLFTSVTEMAPEAAAQYSAAKVNGDLRLGDAHLIWTKASSSVSSSTTQEGGREEERGVDVVQMALVVIQRSSTSDRRSGGDVDMKALNQSMERVAAYSEFLRRKCNVRVSLHFPQFAALSLDASYALDKILRKWSSQGTPCFVYHHVRRRSPRAVASPRLLAVRGSGGGGEGGAASLHDYTTRRIRVGAVEALNPSQERPSGDVWWITLRIPPPEWHLTSACPQTIFVLDHHPQKPSEVLKLHLFILANGGVFATADEVGEYLRQGEAPSRFMLIVDAAKVTLPAAAEEQEEKAVAVVSSQLGRLFGSGGALSGAYVVVDAWLLRFL